MLDQAARRSKGAAANMVTFIMGFHHALENATAADLSGHYER